MRTVLFVFPNAWDRQQLAACQDDWRDAYRILWSEPSDEDCPWDLDPLAFIEAEAAARRGRIHGVTSSSDYPGATVAGALATRLGLPGCPPQRVIRASHKYYSRLAQREAAPEATPPFDLVRSGGPPPATGFPCFVKPVKGAFSIMARRVESAEELEAFLRRPEVEEFRTAYVAIFNRLVRGLTDLEVDGSWFLAEGLLRGIQVTVEGYRHAGRVHVLGIVDSVLHPETGSFARFDYPSSLPPPVQERMAGIAGRVVERLGLDEAFFNIEMIFDTATGAIGLIEVNPRICGQFGDLYQKVDGVNSYVRLLDLACGEDPGRRSGQGVSRCASSFPLRIYQPSRVERAPGPEGVAAARALFPGTQIWLECTAGQVLTDFCSNEDGRSSRYGIVNVGGRDRQEVEDRKEAVLERLGFAFTPLPEAGR